MHALKGMRPPAMLAPHQLWQLLLLVRLTPLL
jgi:hypothetical protein